MKQQRDKQSIERYLLGDLPEDEQVRLEDRAFSEPEYLLAVQAIEKDLIDEYARGELSASDRQKFDEHFLASDERRRKVEFARAFARVSSEYTTAETSAVTPESWWVILRGSLGGRSLALGFSVAALVLLFLVAGLWFLRERTRSQPEQAQNPPTPQASPPIQLNGATPEQLAQNEATPIPTPNKPTLSPEASRPVNASLLLLPGTSRSTENQQQLLIPHAAESAQLRVLVDRAETYKNF